ncbi:MAG: hypothetical protein J5824_09115 [Lachnospiraceae bacterium]|nr:hypothetical protein [Lachnospiraceae bacterium]
MMDEHENHIMAEQGKNLIQERTSSRKEPHPAAEQPPSPKGEGKIAVIIVIRYNITAKTQQLKMI